MCALAAGQSSRARSKATRRRFAATWESFIRQADADGRADFYGLQANVAREVITSGEAFLQILNGDDGLPQLRVIRFQNRSAPLEPRDYDMAVNRA